MKDNNELLLYEPYSSNSGRRSLYFAMNIGTMCNFKCSYCYYDPYKDGHLISKPLLNLIFQKIERYLSSPPSEYSKIMFLWIGGEPLLAGNQFYRDLIDLQQKTFPASVEVQNRIQTNGSLIDDWYAEFFRDHEFAIGLSFDGIPEIHDKYRKDINGNATSGRVINGMRLLKKNGVDFGILATICEEFWGREEEIYQYMKSLGANSIDFMPQLDMKNPDRALDPDIYTHFMINMFKVWTGKEGPNPPVRFLKSCVSKMLGFQGNSVLDFKRTCGVAPEIWRDGGVRYCTDAKALPEFYIGNIFREDLATILERSDQLKKRFFEQRKSCFEACEWSRVCEAGCPLDWRDGKNHFCGAYKKMFPVFREFANLIEKSLSKAEDR